MPALVAGLVCIFALVSCTSPPDTPLTTAVQRGDIEKVRRLLEDRADPDERGHAGWTPLFIAVTHDQNEIAKLLLAAGASVNRRSVAWFYDADGSLPLQRAALRGNTEMVRLLLERGAKADAKDFLAKPTALMSAAQSGSLEIVEMLIAHGADVNARDRQGRRPLHYAAGGGERPNASTREIAQILIAHGANVNGKDRYGNPPLLTAAAEGNVPVLLLLIEHGARTDVSGSSEWTALASAAAAGHLQATQVLEPFFRDDRTAIRQATNAARRAGHESVTAFLTKSAAARPSSP